MAIDFKKWDLAFSLSGHDKGKTYVVVDWDEKNVFLADGKLKTIDNPKKKNLKHVQFAKNKVESFNMLIRSNSNVNDSDLVYLIRQFESNGN